jgi:hypothetical protein
VQVRWEFRIQHLVPDALRGTLCSWDTQRRLQPAAKSRTLAVRSASRSRGRSTVVGRRQPDGWDRRRCVSNLRGSVHRRIRHFKR